MTSGANLSSEKLFQTLESVSANQYAIAHTQSLSGSGFDGVKANAANQRPREKTKKPEEKEAKSRGVCFGFQKGTNCRFKHEKLPEPEKSAASTTTPASASTDTPKPCGACTGLHPRSTCTWKGKCGWCSSSFHSEAACKAKKEGKPKVNTAQVDGSSTRSFCVRVSDPDEPELVHALSVTETTTPPAGFMVEKFYADTGANRSIHPNSRSATTYYRQTLDISTANAGKGMRSEGVGKMQLYAPSGELFPGFDKVVFAKNASEKLASVGELCDAGLVCVFDKHGLRTYSASDCNVTGKIFSQDVRDKKSRLYPLTLFREKTQQVDVDVHAALLEASDTGPMERVYPVTDAPDLNLPSIIPDGDQLPTLLLAHTYIKEGISEVDRLHPKCGDVGIKYLKRAFPDLKVPKKYRCEFCIEGKIHKFSHCTCALGRRTIYPPGVSIAADHSGPYAVSTGGSKYSELFIDEGSDYLWAFRQKAKTDHYEDFPLVIAECRALSGKPLQIFRSDGEGVFSGGKTAAILLSEKVRHEFSAPHDSDTNPKVERARQTIFEGVSTALLRAGAPASFWGEAEAHKVYTINNLPTQPDPNNPGKFVSRWNLLTGSKRRRGYRLLEPW